jgi:hypothetical protein
MQSAISATIQTLVTTSIRPPWVIVSALVVASAAP